MTLEKKMMPQALTLYGDIAKVLVWAQSIPNSGIREGTYQVCIGLLTNTNRTWAILNEKETIEDFAEDCLEKSCPKFCVELIAKNAKSFLWENAANTQPPPISIKEALMMNAETIEELKEKLRERFREAETLRLKENDKHLTV